MKRLATLILAPALALPLAAYAQTTVIVTTPTERAAPSAATAAQYEDPIVRSRMEKKAAKEEYQRAKKEARMEYKERRREATQDARASGVTGNPHGIDNNQQPYLSSSPVGGVQR